MLAGDNFNNTLILHSSHKYMYVHALGHLGQEKCRGLKASSQPPEAIPYLWTLMKPRYLRLLLVCQPLAYELTPSGQPEQGIWGGGYVVNGIALLRMANANFAC
jgi:hypothetical protein